ncbi:MAG: outer membrane beta-barrel protein [Taibaiella sp.]|nr:outer membrane beta-barrel protein [Taibaiella sp.]
MKRIAVIILCLLLMPGFSHAQYLLKGKVMDTLNNQPLVFASVVALRGTDSVIQAFSRVNGAGDFELKLPAEGKYIVRISYPSFADYQDAITVKNATTEMGLIPMATKERLLKEFVLTKQVAAIKIKGDTTEYVADSFKTKENATVEDLLKKLPGIQVDKDGKITAQGVEVKKILVDGEEFFSDDPKVITKGLQAGALDKVQVFDKKSDQAEFTGIDDGEKTKTINLELKEDKKKGFFGKIDGGGGSDGYFQNQGMINAFKAKRQFSAFAIMSNTDKAGLGWGDNDKFSSGATTNITDDGMMYSSISSDDDFAGWDGKYQGEGLPKTWTGGAHFANKWKKDTFHVSANYRYARQNVEIGGTTTTQYTMPDDKGLVQTANKNQFSQGERHAVDGLFEWKVDSLTTLKILADAGTKNMETFTKYHTESVNSEQKVQNVNDRTINSDSKAKYFNSSLALRKKFSKIGRTLSADIKENYKESGSDGFLHSFIAFPVTDTITNTVNLDTTFTNQKKDNKTGSLLFSTKVTYTEPLSKVSFLVFDYSITVNNSSSKNYSYDSTAPGQYNSLNALYSNEYQYNILTNRGGVNYKYVDKKLTVSAGGAVSEARYSQTDLLYKVNSLKRNYLNFFPSASFNYKLKKQTSISLRYDGNTRQPTLNEVQPLRQNNDPLNQVIGNPQLKQEFSNRFNLNFNDYKVLSSRYIYISATFRTIGDAISTSQQIRPSGNTMQYINVDGNYSGNLYGGANFKLKKIPLYIGLNVNAAQNHSNNIVNDTANVNDNNSFGPGISFYLEKEEKYQFELRPSIEYNFNKSTISSFTNSYWIFSTNLSGTVQLPKKFEIGSNADILVRQKTAIFNQNNNVVRWNAYVSKKLLKKGELEVRLSIYDILNQNIGYDRTSENGIVTENKYNTIRRYGMLNVIWNFTHSPGGVAPVSTEE